MNEHSLAAERAVLGSILLDSATAFPPVLQILKPEDFFEEKNARIYGGMLDLFKRSVPIDTMTVMEALNGSGSPAVDAAYISRLIDGVPDTGNVKFYAGIVKEKATLRRLADAGRRITRDALSAEKGAAQICDEAAKTITRVGADASAAEGTGAGRTWEGWPSADAYLRPDAETGERLTTGFPALDDKENGATPGGIRRGKVVVFQSRPGMGKTSLAKQIGVRAAREHGAVFVGVFDDEGPEQGAVMIGEDFGFERAKLEARDSETLAAFAAAREPYAIRLPDPDDPETFVEALVEALAGVPPERMIVLVLDSAQTVRCREGMNAKSDRERVAALMAAARAAAKRLRAVVIVISQTNRDSYRHKKESENIDALAAGAESRAIEYCSDLLLHFTGDPEDVVTVKMPRNRLGPKKTFRLRFDPKTATFSEIDEKTAAAEALEAKEGRERERVAKLADRAEKLLGEKPNLTGRQIEELLGCRGKDSRAALQLLREKGRADGKPGPKGSVLWTIPDPRRPIREDE